MKTKKSSRRTKIVKQLMESLKNPEIYEGIYYKRKKESYIKKHLHDYILAKIKDIYQEISQGSSVDLLKKKAENSLMWEGDPRTTIPNFIFLGVQHRPDFEVHIDNMKIALEIKLGEAGVAVREGIGQSIVYASSERYDFVVYLFIDISKDKKIQKSQENKEEKLLIKNLWDNFNVLFAVV